MTRFLRSVLGLLAASLLPIAPAAAQVAGGALQCDGINDYAVVPDSQGDFDLGNAMTLEAWVRPDSFSDFAGYVTGFSGSFGIYGRDNGEPSMLVSVPATASATAASGLSMGVWTHVAGTYDGSTLRLYVNGVPTATKAHPGSATNASELRICGFSPSTASLFHGAIDEVRVWEVVRSGSQIAATYNRRLSGLEPGLVAYYRFDEPSGQTLVDGSPRHNDGFLGATSGSSNDDPMRIQSAAPLLGPGPCLRNANTACLLDDRFEVKVRMWNFAHPPVSFPGVIQTYGGQSSETDQSVSFFSFQEGNVELFVKMVDACANGAFHSYWLFTAGATNAESEVVVRDTVAEEVAVIHNPPSMLFQTVANTQAFKTCDF